MKLSYWLCFFIFLGCLLQSCEGEKASPVYKAPVKITYEIDGQQVKADTMLYDHPAGYRYSLSKLEYYLSNFALLNDKDEIWESSEIYYLNLERSNTNLLMLQGVSTGNFTSIRFDLGIDEMRNLTGALPNTIEYTQMAWPDPMGGGYHFMKLEGLYQPGISATVKGYAMHLGKNENLVQITIDEPFSIGEGTDTLRLVMNINEWFRTPHQIDFEKDGTYSMSDGPFMRKLAENGKNVFKLKR